MPLVVSQRLAAESPARVRRLETLVELKKLYRNCLRADTLLSLASPVYEPLPEGSDAAAAAASAPAAASAAAASAAASAAGDGAGQAADAAEERRIAAVELVAEMQLTSEQLRQGLRALSPGFGREFKGIEWPAGGNSGNSGGAAAAGADAADAATERIEAAIRDAARDFAQRLRERAARELPLLPFESEAQAQVALDVRNSRYNRRLQQVLEDVSSLNGGSVAGGGSSGSLSSLGGAGAAGGGGTGSGSLGSGGASPVAGGPAAGLGGAAAERLTKAERVAEKFVENRIKPALARAQERDLVEVLQESSSYLRGLWDRLNGGGGGARRALPAGLPLPAASRKEVERVIGELGRELESLEKRLVDASKARESKLRKVRARAGGNVCAVTVWLADGRGR